MTSIFGGSQTVPQTQNTLQNINQATQQSQQFQQQQATAQQQAQDYANQQAQNYANQQAQNYANQQTGQTINTGSNLGTYNANTLAQALGDYLRDAAIGIGTPQQVPGLNIAPLTPEQLNAIGGLYGAGMAWAPGLMQSGYSAMTSAGAPITAADIQGFYNPFAANVTANLQDVFNQQALANRLGGTAAIGGVGGDRAAVAQALMAKEQGMAAGQVYADLYQRALAAAQQQKAQQLGAGQAAFGTGMGGLQTALGAASIPQAQQQAINQAIFQQLMGQYQDPFMRLQAQAGAMPGLLGLGGENIQFTSGLQNVAGSAAGFQNMLQSGLQNMAQSGTQNMTGLTAMSGEALGNQAGTLAGSQLGTGFGQTTYPAPSLLSQLTGLGTLGLGAFSLFSDRRGKTDLQRVGKSSEGIPLYAYRYKGDPKTYPKVIGPMAQDVKKKYPEAVVKLQGGGGVGYFGFPKRRRGMTEEEKENERQRGAAIERAELAQASINPWAAMRQVQKQYGFARPGTSSMEIDVGGYQAFPSYQYGGGATSEELEETAEPESDILEEERKKAEEQKKEERARRYSRVAGLIQQGAKFAKGQDYPASAPIKFPEFSPQLPSFSMPNLFKQREGGRIEDDDDWQPGMSFDRATYRRLSRLSPRELATAASDLPQIRNNPVFRTLDNIVQRRRRMDAMSYQEGGEVGLGNEEEPVDLPLMEAPSRPIPHAAGPGGIGALAVEATPLPVARPAAPVAAPLAAYPAPAPPAAPAVPSGGFLGGLRGAPGTPMSQSPAFALMQAGLGMLAASGQRDARGLPMAPLAAIGQGGMAGLETYAEGQQMALKERMANLREQAMKNLERYRQESLALRGGAGTEKPIVLETPLGRVSAERLPDGKYRNIVTGEIIGGEEAPVPTQSPQVKAEVAGFDVPKDEQGQVAAAVSAEDKISTPISKDLAYLLKSMGTTPEQFDFNAKRLAFGDTSMTSGVRSKAGAMYVQALRARAAQYFLDKGMTPEEANQAVAEFGAMKAGTRSLAQQEARVTGALVGAEAVAPIVLETSAKIPRTGIKSLNDVYIRAQEQFGSEAAVRYKTSIETLVTNYAAALGRGSAVLTDTMQRRAQGLLERGFTHGQVEAAVDQMLIEIDREKKGIARGMKTYLKRDETTYEPGSVLKKPATGGAPLAVEVPTIRSKDEYEKLPSGSEFIGSDGKKYRKP